MKLSPRDRILLAVIGAVVILGGAYWFVVRPASADLSAARDELTTVRSEAGDLRDTLDRLSGSQVSPAKLAAERLRLSKALPQEVETPGVIVQLQRLADRANVSLTSIKTNSFSDYGAIRGTEFEVRVSGRFFDVDDFLYRLHRQVTIDEKDAPTIGGRLFATTSVDLSLDQNDPAGGAPSDDDRVLATLKVVAFSSVPGGAASDPTAVAAAAGTPIAGAATPDAAVAAAENPSGGVQ